MTTNEDAIPLDNLAVCEGLTATNASPSITICSHCRTESDLLEAYWNDDYSCYAD